jgi:hypothetical protein
MLPCRRAALRFGSVSVSAIEDHFSPGARAIRTSSIGQRGSTGSEIVLRTQRPAAIRLYFELGLELPRGLGEGAALIQQDATSEMRRIVSILLGEGGDVTQPALDLLSPVSAFEEWP